LTGRRLAAACPLAAAVAFAGCSLGLDESKIGAVPDGGEGGLPPIDGAPPQSDAIVPDAIVPDTGAPDAGPGCNVDGDCVAPSACLTPRCDVARHTCVYDLCKQTAACTRAACDPSSHTCGSPAPVAFHPGSFKVTTGGIGCGGVVGKCVAALGSFLYVSTTGGAFAYPVADPENTAPSPIAITGLPFQPAAVTASGNRVWFTGGFVGAKLQMAWVDAPTSPLATTLVAHTVLVATTLTAATSVFPARAGGVFVEQGDATRLFPTGRIDAPLTDPSTLDVFPNAGASTAAVAVASSGDRLVFYRWSQQGAALGELFSIATGAGTANAKAGTEVNLGVDVGQVWGTPGVSRFAQGTNGALLWGVPWVEIGVQPVGTKAARVVWVLTDDTVAAATGAAHVDVELYDPNAVGVGQPVAGPLAWVDATTVLALAQAPTDLAQTSVQVVQSSAGALAVVAGRRVVLPASTDKLGAVSANGYAFVVAADAPDSATVYVFAPGCP
jgi:hypothetical protein